MKKLGLWLVLLAACGGSAHVEGSAEGAEVSAQGGESDLQASVPPAPAEPAPPAAAAEGKDPYAGSIERAGLIAIVDQGLGRFFAHLKLRPVLDGKRFQGFAVAGIDPAWGETGLKEGDVLLRVNGQVIERPEQAMAAFEGLRVASEVVVELTRSGVPATLRYRID